MKNPEIQNIKILFDKTFNGPAWHGPSVKEVLKDLSHEDVLKSVGNAHNITEIVFHMIAWRNFLINKLKGQESYDVSKADNFQKFEHISEQEWTNLKDRLENSQKELQDLLSKVDDDILNQKIGMRGYNFYTLMPLPITHKYSRYSLDMIQIHRFHSN